MIVFAHKYQSANVSKVEYHRFERWSLQARLDVSHWRVTDPEQATWLIVVVDESDGRTLREFDWRGELVALPLAQAAAFVERRISRLVAASRTCDGPYVSEELHYGPAIAPKLRENGVWEMPSPGQG